MKGIWEAWTKPSQLKKWFCPKPWLVTDCRIDLRPGVEFFTLMQGPEGQKMPNDGCFLEVVENQKLVWTNMMTSGYRPNISSSLDFPFVAHILLSNSANKNSYKAIVTHGDEMSRQKHEKMGFQEGWGIAFEQLSALLKM